jgi:hypothetical protein
VPEKKFEPLEHDPVGDDARPLTREEFVRACATALFDYDDTFKVVDAETNPFQNTPHTFNEWLTSFRGYISW